MTPNLLLAEELALVAMKNHVLDGSSLAPLLRVVHRLIAEAEAVVASVVV